MKWRCFTINKFKTFLSKYKVDLIVVVSILVVALTATITLFATSKKDNLTAKIYRQDEVIEVVDLSKESEPRTFTIEGKESEMVIEVKHNAIRVKEASCPHQDCVTTSWVSSTNRPIICVYNAVYIRLINGTSNVDIEV